MSDARISQLSITPTVGRQTPKRDFGDVLKNTVGRVLNNGIVKGALSSIPVVSAAVSAVNSMASSSATSSTARASVAGVAGGVVSLGGMGGSTTAASSGVATGATATGGDSVDPNGALEEMRRVSADYMQLQLAMQQENREYNAMTNVLKVRHDSAKSAINNIR
jgi:hypothetical protein